MSIITFGKYRGSSYEDLPIDYLNWLEQTTKGIIQSDASNELKRRSSIGITSKLSRQEWSEQMAILINKMPEGLKEQNVQYNGWEVKLRKL